MGTHWRVTCILFTARMIWWRSWIVSSSERQNVAETLKGLEATAKELEVKVEGLRTGPTEREVLEQQKTVLEEDVNKFHAMIAELNARVGALNKSLEEKEKELQAKEVERSKISEENAELKKRVELQTFNSRDVERMRRELVAAERDIEESQRVRNSWEDKCWDADTKIRDTFTELHALAIECNQAIRRLKLSNGFQFELNGKGKTPAEIMGAGYRSNMKPELQSYTEKVWETSKIKFDEFIVLQQRLKEMAAKIEERRNQIAAIQSHISEVEAQMGLIKKEIQDHTCAAEREAVELLKAAQQELDEATIRCEEEIQVHAHDLFRLVDAISKYKESVESKISSMRNELSESAAAVLDTYRGADIEQFSDYSSGTRN